MNDLVKRLITKSRMIALGEPIAHGSDSAIMAEAADRIEALEKALESIKDWSEAYPLSVFPEPDFAKANEVLKAAGMTLDGISASNMRNL